MSLYNYSEKSAEQPQKREVRVYGVGELLEKIELLAQHQNQQDYRLPTSTLVFKSTNLPAKHAPTLGKHDGKIYCINLDGTLERFDSIEDETPAQVGTIIPLSVYGKPEVMFVTHEGICVVTSNTADNKGYILYLDSLDGQLQVAYERSGIRFVDRFGHDIYYTGLGSIILVGEYGDGALDRRLLMSTDGGKTFASINTTTTVDLDINSHWHDVAFDPYDSIIWASQGDGPNARTSFSPDFGENWYDLKTNLWPNDQPTMIIPFPSRVLFGRDMGTKGTHVFDKRLIRKSYHNLPDECYSNVVHLRPLEGAGIVYAQGEVREGSEAYFTWATDSPGAPVIATGDFGRSIHMVYVASNGPGVCRGFWGIDKKYVYGYQNIWAGGTTKLMYAERLQFDR